MPTTHKDELDELDEPPGVPVQTQKARSPERVVDSRELLGGAHRIWIEHAAERYLLQVTRSGKLILTK